MTKNYYEEWCRAPDSVGKFTSGHGVKPVLLPAISFLSEGYSILGSPIFFDDFNNETIIKYDVAHDKEW